MGATKITLVRHGQSESNLTGHWQGQGNSPLSEAGRTQARALAQRLRARRFDRIISSDLRRAADTARATAEVLELEPELRHQWREIDVGTWEGLTQQEVEEHFPEQMAALKKGDSIKVGGGESWVDLAARSVRALHTLRSELRPGDHALVFAHGGVIASLVASILNLIPSRPRRLGNVANAAMTTLRFETPEDAAPSLEVFNDGTHVDPLTQWSRDRMVKGAAVVGFVPAGATYHAAVEDLPHGFSEESFHEHLVGYATSRPGENFGLRVATPLWAPFARRLLGPSVQLAEATRVTHVVVSDRGHTLADFNVGDEA